MCFELGSPCMSDVPNTKFTGLTRFVFKQKQRANTTNPQTLLWTHTECTHSQVHKEFSASFFGSETLKGVWPILLWVWPPPLLRNIHILPLTWKESVLCSTHTNTNIHTDTDIHTHTLVLNPTRAFWSLSLILTNFFYINNFTTHTKL